MIAILYGTNDCSKCKIAKKYLTEHHVEVVEIKVDEDQSMADEMIQKSGQMSVPVIDIDGNIIIGFSPMRLDKLIGA